MTLVKHTLYVRRGYKLKYAYFELCICKASLHKFVHVDENDLLLFDQARIEMENTRREYLCCSSQSRKTDALFDANDRECAICHYDLYLSAAGCPCSPDKFACLIHAKQLCSCDWSTRFFLFRYDISELNVLVDALGGKLSAVHRWGISNLGLTLSSIVGKEKMQENKPVIVSNKDGKKEEVSGQLNNLGNLINTVRRPSTHNESERSQSKNVECFSLQQSKSANLLSGSGDSRSSSDVKLKGSSKLLPDKANEELSSESSRSPSRLIDCDDKATSSNLNKDLVIVSPETNASAINEKDSKMLPIIEKSHNNLDLAKAEVKNQASATVPIAKPISKFLAEKEPCSSSTPNISGRGKTPSDERMEEKTESVSGCEVGDRGNSVSASPFCTQNRPQKGPRIAKVVRRINCTVEPLEYGGVLSRKQWSTSQAIFPKGTFVGSN